MSGATLKSVILSIVLASSLPLAACGDDSNSPTSPTQPGPPVGEHVTVNGSISNLNRSGPDGLNVTFRIDDVTIVRAAANTPVITGSMTSNTSALRSGQPVAAEGFRANGILDATRITITNQ
jgi:hypothetical protein